MFICTKRLFLPALALAFFMGAAAAEGASPRATAGRDLVLAQADGPSLQETVERVRRQYNGRIVSAETRVRGSREVHVIKVLTEDGKVKTVQIPGRSRRG